MVILILFVLFFSIYSIIPNWNLQTISKDLLPTSTTPPTDYISFDVANRHMYGVTGRLEKLIRRWPNGTITHNNTLYVKNDGNSESDYKFPQKINFENIESLYKLNDRRILCPVGKYHVIDLNADLNVIKNNNFEENNEWDLKCYYHDKGYFFVYYLYNGRKQVYNLPEVSVSGYTSLDHLILYDELYDFKLVNGNSQTTYPLWALVNKDGYIFFVATEYNFGTSISKSDDKLINITKVKTHTQAYFNYYTNHFYFVLFNQFLFFFP